MNPSVELISEENNTLSFKLSGVNVSLANAIRRTILSDIPIVVFKTAPYEENKANIMVNTSRLNNEVIKQRLSCIPIHMSDFESIPLKDLLLEVNVENITDTIMFVTTENFKIKNLVNDTYLNKEDTLKIFPPDDYTGYFIDFVRLRPKISDEILGEKLQLTCELSVDTAKTDGMFNVASTCSYGFTIDEDEIEKVLVRKVAEWKSEGLSKEEIILREKDWRLLDGMRITRPDSFDFIIKSIGIYTNHELINKACEILIQRLTDLDTLIETDKLTIKKAENTMENSYDIIMENEDYTIGKVIEFMLYTKFYEGVKSLTFCGFKKMHPHDSESIIRVAYNEVVDNSIIKQNLKECIVESIRIYQKIKKDSLKLLKA